jgi:hypothetical protein
VGHVPFRCISFPYPKRHRSAPIVVKKVKTQKVKTQKVKTQKSENTKSENTKSENTKSENTKSEKQRNQCMCIPDCNDREKGPTQFQHVVRITHVIYRRRKKKRISHVNTADDDEKATDLNGRECPNSAWRLCNPSGYTT